MITINLNLPDGMKHELDARLREAAYSSIEDYVRDLIQSDLGRDDHWEMTPELAAALAEGAESGIDHRSIDQIIAEGRKRWNR